MIEAISPIDGRYAGKTSELSPYFSEYALIRYRVRVEIAYFKSLIDNNISILSNWNSADTKLLSQIAENFNLEDAERIKEIERTTNHDVKAVEYFIKEKFDAFGWSQYKEFIHFGLTSQDINNTALPWMVKDAMESVVLPGLRKLRDALHEKVTDYEGVSMLARTHGQPASPTTMGKEWMVFVDRLSIQIKMLEAQVYWAKFGGATGSFNAHKVAFPAVDWRQFGDRFISGLGMKRLQFTTQIDHYDHLAELFHTCSRINTIFIDFCRDIWSYISMDYFKQKVIANEVGSSAMPHKVNPIDFENAEGNLGLANALFIYLSEKLPVSRLQRDLTDSTVSRNFGVPFSHSLIAYKAMEKGIGKLLINKEKMDADLDANWAVVSEAIQNILRRESYPKPYEALKSLTRGKATITEKDIKGFIDELNIPEKVKVEMRAITPHNYIGYA